MEVLPPEIHYQLLLKTPSKDLVNFCRVSSDYYKVCSSRGFWIRKFREENIPILVEGDSLREWLDIYELSSLAYYKAKEGRRNAEYSFSISTYADPFIFSVKGKIKQKVIRDILLQIRQDNVEKTIEEIYDGTSDISSILTEDLAIEGISPERSIPSTSILVKLKIGKNATYAFDKIKVSLTEEELVFLLYKLFFFFVDEPRELY